jgi:hypothetical protein
LKGCVIDDGEGILKVQSVGKETYFGSLYLENIDKSEDRESPLQVGFGFKSNINSFR